MAALLLVGFADEWFTFLPAGAFEALRLDLGLTYAQAGLILAALSLGGLLGMTFEVAADYVSRRWLAASGAAAYGAAMIVFGLGDGFWTLLAAAFVWGAASDAFIHGCEVALVDLAPGPQLPRALARQHAWSAVGDLLAPASLAAAALAGLDWRGLFLGGGGLMLAYGAWLSAYRFPPPAPPSGHETPLRGLLAVMRDGRVLLIGAIMGLYGLLDEPLVAFLIARLEDQGHSRAAAVMLPLGLLVGGLVGFILAERLAAGRAARDLIRPAAGVMALSLPPALFAPGWALVPAGFVFGMAGAVFYTALHACMLSLRPGQAGSTSAVVSAIGLAGAAFPALVGAVADAWGLGAGLALYAVTPLLVLVLVLRLDLRGA